MRKKSLFHNIRAHYVLYLFVLPGLIAVVLFNYVPMFGLTIAFTDYTPVRGFENANFVGFRFFEQALSDRHFRAAVVNTFIIKLGQTLVTLPFSILFALLLFEIGKRFRMLFQTVSMFPFFVSWVVVAAMMRVILNPTTGIVNQMLVHVFGFAQPVTFLSDPTIFRYLVILQDAWKMGGYWALIYLAAMTAIDPSLFEVATIDGAGRWRQMWNVTLPCIRPTILTMLILLMGYLVIGPFDQIFTQYSPAVYSTGDIVETFTYRMGIGNQRYGFATATGLMQGIVATALVLTTNAITKKAKADERLI
jgi:ABC-type polysaccharide transport system permease subunit